MRPSLLLLLSLSPLALHAAFDKDEAVRVVRIQLNYEQASTREIDHIGKWSSLLKSSLLASLRFINKHWLICGGSEEDKKSATDCGKAHITGETMSDSHYRVNVTFVAERDPVKNAKVEATSTVFGVVQIGLKGGIFQYTNPLKILGKPTPTLILTEKFFCYKGFRLAEDDKCVRDHRQRLADQPLVEVEKPLALRV
ncbi:hypothetical protein PRIPAC_76648 [Pristionchus pacificus]|uniref:Uncharacterized protein n=1 Tax=Pristionchus pacificus TaxID=54126 RepID=A0A2A6C0G7_PRIPA|nr:hypothetical protein PRIPAC_76648 [Pristionchus pacificus]|eukprot:PDM71674.1 hypothetical protein PRIPAC_38081 [Pristionchus pacificus]